MKYFFCIFLLLLASCKGDVNIENAKKVKIGMTNIEVRRVMGKPDDSINSYLSSEQFMYIYKAPFASSDDINIHFDTAKKIVTNIVLPKDY